MKSSEEAGKRGSGRAGRQAHAKEGLAAAAVEFRKSGRGRPAAGKEGRGGETYSEEDGFAIN